MPQWYETEDIEATLTQPYSHLRDTLALGQFCLQISHLERCFTHKVRSKPQDDILPNELYRYLVKYQIWPTSGELQAMTVAYQDLIRKDKKRKPTCIIRIGTFRHEKDITACTLGG